MMFVFTIKQLIMLLVLLYIDLILINKLLFFVLKTNIVNKIKWKVLKLLMAKEKNPITNWICLTEFPRVSFIFF